MAKIFRYIFKNIFFAGWRVLFQYKDKGTIIKGQGIYSGNYKPDVKIVKDEKEAPLTPAPYTPLITHISLFGHIRIFLTHIAYNILHFIVGSSIKITIEGEDNIPKGTQRALIVANHSSYLDVPIIGYTFFNNLIDLSWVVSKSNYKLWFLKWLWLIFKPIVVERGGTIDKIKKDLAYSRWVVLFPEGNEKWCPPSEAAKKRVKPSSGASVVALSTGVTIIPVGITGADKVLPARSFHMDTRYHITVRIGKPFSYDKVEADKIDQGMINETRQGIMNRIYPLVDHEHKEMEEKKDNSDCDLIRSSFFNIGQSMCR